ncbi:MAG: AAA family ATPase, partial [Clostridia bacterium]|nr:AAA family ATPase [Clostridia bacterium]
NVREQSNGESAFYYFTQKIGEGGLYLLDEPENSLSPGRQQELAAFMEDSARFFRCQFVIATHSPFVLALREAKIYDLDGDPAAVHHWTELPAVRAYYEFFKKHERELERD